MTEPGAGSDVAAIRTTCKKDGDYYILNGTKCFITNGKHADKITVLASHDPSKGHRAQSFFMVDTKTEGVSFGKSERKMGMRCSETSEVIFDNVKVHKKYRIGEEGDGFKLAMKAFNSSRPFIAAASTGVAQAAFEYARDYAKQRMAFGKPIGSHQAVAFMLADMAMEIEASRLLWQKAAWLLDEDLMSADLSAMSECYAADAANRVVTNAVQILGGYGFCRDYPVEKMMRDAKILQIFEGARRYSALSAGACWLKNLIADGNRYTQGADQFEVVDHECFIRPSPGRPAQQNSVFAGGHQFNQRRRCDYAGGFIDTRRSWQRL